MGDETPLPMKQVEMTPFALAMPDKYKQDSAVWSYRNYYLGEKVQGNFWTKRQFELDDWLIFNLTSDQFKE